MKKSLILSIALLICGSVAYSQNSKSFYKSSYETRNSGSWEKSAMILNFGLGFPNTAVGGYSYGLYDGNRSASPAFYAKFEHGFLRDEVGLGGYLSAGFGSLDYDYQNSYKTKISAISFGVLGYYHFNKLIPIEKLDVYAGAGLAFRNISYKRDDNGTNPDSDGTVLGIFQAGARYYVKPKLGFYLEVGYDGMSNVNLGVTLKLK